MRRIIGIDPGLAGGLGVLDVGDHGEHLHAELARTPVTRIKRKRGERVEYDVPAMRTLLSQAIDGRPPTIAAVEVVLEEQQAMPTALRGRAQGGRSTFRTGLGYGLWLGLIVASRVAYTTVRPVAWKRRQALIGADKAASRLRCGQRFPSLAPIRAKDEGPAEALLIADVVAHQHERRET
jgi:hypothetical protein